MNSNNARTSISNRAGNKSLLCCGNNSIYKNSSIRRHRIKYFLDHAVWWKGCLVLCTIVLLFGGNIRDLFLPGYEIMFDIFFFVAMFNFTIDMVLRIDSEPFYFNLFCCGTNYYSSAVEAALAASTAQNRSNNNNNRDSVNDQTSGNYYNQMKYQSSGLRCSIGSFLFWCDAVSILSLFSEISWLNPSRFGEIKYFIDLNEDGLPVCNSVALRSFD
jgi:hypothetical protein